MKFLKWVNRIITPLLLIIIFFSTYFLLIFTSESCESSGNPWRVNAYQTEMCEERVGKEINNRVLVTGLVLLLVGFGAYKLDRKIVKKIKEKE